MCPDEFVGCILVLVSVCANDRSVAFVEKVKPYSGSDTAANLSATVSCWFDSLGCIAKEVVHDLQSAQPENSRQEDFAPRRHMQISDDRKRKAQRHHIEDNAHTCNS